MFNLFESLLPDAAQGINLPVFAICLASALVLGAVMALGYTYRTSYTKSFVISLALLPAITCVVIMMVSGSLGAGVAVAGVFSLVRFRSNPGTAKEICAVFLSMAVGLAMSLIHICPSSWRRRPYCIPSLRWCPAFPPCG